MCTNLILIDYAHILCFSCNVEVQIVVKSAETIVISIVFKDVLFQVSAKIKFINFFTSTKIIY